MKLKICGMKHNTDQVAALKPDYLGFIFYGKSLRNFDGEIPELPTNVQKVGVFVNEQLDAVVEKNKKHALDVLQLHGEETAQYCSELKQVFPKMTIWKVFPIKDDFNFDQLRPFEPHVDAFLFDTKGPAKGGNGYTFDWRILNNYNSSTSFILSGGIGIEHISEIKKIHSTKLPLLAIDVNSKFENSPGNKNITTLTQFKERLAI